MSSEDPTPVTRLELRRLQLWDLVRRDDLLRGCPLLKVLHDAAAQQLLDGVVVRRFPDRASVMAEGSAPTGVLLVLKGEARLTCQAEHEQLEFAVALKGALLGEAALGTSQVYTAVACGELDVAELDAHKVTALAHAHRDLMEHLRAVDRERRTAREEMTAFLGRW